MEHAPVIKLSVSCVYQYFLERKFRYLPNISCLRRFLVNYNDTLLYCRLVLKPRTSYRT